MTRVLITGAGGFVGSNLLTAVPQSWDTDALSRRPLVARPGIRGLLLGRSNELPGSLLEHRYDVVVHLAGNADHGLAVREPWSDLASTGVLAASILGRVSARRVVLLSSAAVYAGLDGPMDPARPAQPKMAYALSKLYVEGFVQTLAAERRIESAAILRLYNGYGPGERSTRLIPRVVAAARARAPFKLTGAPDSLSDPVHVDDVVASLIAASEVESSGTWDLAGGDPRPLLEQVARIARALGSDAPPIVVEPDPTQVPIRFWSDPGPLADALGIPLPVSFDLGVERYARTVGWLSPSTVD